MGKSDDHTVDRLSQRFLTQEISHYNIAEIFTNNNYEVSDQDWFNEHHKKN